MRIVFDNYNVWRDAMKAYREKKKGMTMKSENYIKRHVKHRIFEIFFFFKYFLLNVIIKVKLTCKGTAFFFLFLLIIFMKGDL